MGSKKLFLASIVAISLSCCLGVTALAYIFMIVPNERTMGAVQRIFYFHVGSAVSSYLAILIMVGSAISYLQNRKSYSSAFNLASAEVAFVLCTITLVTGMIWGKAAWNTAFQMEPRLISFLMLWFIIASANMIGWLSKGRDVSNARAILSILAAISIPVVILSVKLLPQTAQLHPQVLENRGLKDPSYETAFMLSLMTLLCFCFALIVTRARQIVILNRLVYR